MNPYIRSFFNATAGLEKFIIGVLAAIAAYVTALETLDEATSALIVALIGAVQMLYTTNAAPSPAPAKPVTETKEKLK